MKKLGLLILLVVLVAVLILTGLGLPLVGYAPRASERYLWGAVHVHSDLSDGLAPLEEVARAASASRLDFIMLSDHGSPHPEATLIDETLDGVRIIGGSEVGLPEGHLIVADVDRLPPYKLPPYPPEAIGDVREWGGFAIVTYPEDPAQRWSYWENDLLPDGLEIINVTSYFRASSAFDKLRWAWFSLFSPYYYVKSLLPPTYALARWDELLERGPAWGFYATNAHGGFPVTEDMTVSIPSYETAFSYVGLGVDREYGDDPMRAIRSGDFFAVVRGAGEPDRFVFRADENARPGSFAPSGSKLHVVIDAPGLATRVVLKRGGEPVGETTERELDFEAATSGVYRVEVYLDDHPLLASNVPWILSNPIFVGLDFPPVVVEELRCSEVEPLDLEAMRLEKDDESTGSITITDEGALELTYELSKATPDKVDRWIALALRRPLDFSAHRGILLEAESPRTMRYWVELRAEGRSHYGSIKLYRGHNRIAVPWSHFYAMFGPREKPLLGRVDSLFLTVNTSSSYTGFGGALTVTSLGGCH